ncbi:hypothetical protein SAMN05444161_2900 [Rhizobiales bacterium GAS191]|nr:hypothetical protein SAMN05444161_2900 [Rhizobiales bacterium GAS191]
MKLLAIVSFAAAVAISGSAFGQSACRIQRQEVFQPQGKRVVLATAAGAQAGDQFVLFRSQLRVNTDGAPNSYHPDDLKGSTKAINNIANGVAVTRGGKGVGYAQTIKVFGDFRDNNWTVPGGYKITWQNVLAARNAGNGSIPCVFAAGDHRGYFGSLTALKNGLSGGAAGECEVANQLDERFIPALVIAGGSNPLKHFQVAIGDLVLAVNPENGVVEAAVVGDQGPPDNLGEGSVALNMALLQRTNQPTNYAEAKQLDTGSRQMIVAIVPGSASYKLERPYSVDNIGRRVAAWLAEHHYGSLAGFAGLMKACAGQL